MLIRQNKGPPLKVSSHNLLSFQVSYLRSGHTHEDIDQIFSRMSKYLQRVRTMHTLSDVVTTVQKFADSAKFPFEADRYVQVIDDVRDWNLSVLLCWVHFICASSEVGSEM